MTDIITPTLAVSTITIRMRHMHGSRNELGIEMTTEQIAGPGGTMLPQPITVPMDPLTAMRIVAVANAQLSEMVGQVMSQAQQQDEDKVLLAKGRFVQA